MKYEQPYGVSDPNASYVNGNPSTGTMGSIPPAASIENPQREIVNLITDANAVVPADTDLHQLGKSVQSGKINYGVDIGVANAMIVPLVPIPDAYSAGMVVRLKAKFAPTAATTLDAGRGARAVVKSGGAALQGSEWSIGDIITVAYDIVTNHWQLPPSPVAMLYAPRTYYVNSGSGSDSNDGLTAGTAFLTLQHAQDTISRFNLNGYNVTVNAANGTYGPLSCGPVNGSGTITYIGNTATPSAAIVQNTAGPAITVRGGGTGYTFNGFRVTATGNAPGVTGSGLYCVTNSALYALNIDFGYCIDHHIAADGGAEVSYYGPFSISGGAGGAHILSQNNSYVAVAFTPTALNILSPAAIGTFITAFGGGVASIRLSITGFANVTGQKYSAVANGIVNSSGGGVNYYPGTIAGTTASGGQYV